VLHPQVLFDRDGLTFADVRCRHGAGRGAEERYEGRHAIVLVRRGCFVRSADGLEATLDPTLAYAMAPGEIHRYDHPHGEGDDCTAVFLDPALLASLWGGEPGVPPGALRAAPAVDVEHRALLAAARRGDDGVFERAVGLVAALLGTRAPARVASGRPVTAAERRRLAAAAREALAADPGLSLPALARELAVSPHHLSRVFRAETGETVSGHRRRLRARLALERLAAGQRDLARLAADTGFADQSHLCRVLKDETQRTPAALRALLS
jgi:AraC-like DNA-binding protein